MENNQGKATSAPLIDRRPTGERLSARHGKRPFGSRYWPAILISMIVVPMVVVLGFYAAVPAKALGPAPVNLLTAGDFAILAGTGITATGTAGTLITGDIGVSPSLLASITGFSPTYNPGDAHATSALVIGYIYAPNMADPTPTKMTTAQNDLVTVYNNAAAVTPDFTDLYSGHLAGKTLTPGCYKWTTAVDIGIGGLTLSGGPNDVWVFEIAQTFDLASATAVTLSPGVSDANIFWAVAGVVTLGTTSTMHGNILAATGITIMTSATLDGRALSQTLVTLDGNIVTEPAIGIPEFSQVLVPLVGMMSIVAIAGMVRNQRK